MGFLTDSARKAYKKGSRRAYVPDWFLPASYVFAAFVAIVLLFATLRGSEPRSFTVEDPKVTVPVSGSPTITTGDSLAPGGTNVSGATQSVVRLDGSSVTLPVGAEAMARAAVVALFTGEFTDVALYPGQLEPVVIAPWKNVAVIGVSEARTPDATTVTVTYRIDPDGDGMEQPRDITVMVVRNGDDWAYLPG